jgi:hypothetical protein
MEKYLKKSFRFDKNIFLQIYFSMLCMLTNSLVLICLEKINQQY